MLSGELQVTPTVADNTPCTGEGRLAKSSLTSGLILSCQLGVWKNSAGRPTLEHSQWYLTSAYHGWSNYGNACANAAAARGYTASGWVVTGQDACSEDDHYCTTDGILCFMVRVRP